MDFVGSDHPNPGGLMTLMDRVTGLLLGSRQSAALFVALLLIALWPAFASAAPPISAEANPSTAELEQLVQTLKDDKDRHAFVAQLETLIASHRAATAKPSEPEDLVSILSERINAIDDEVLAAAAVLVDATLLLAWAKGQIANEHTRALWVQVAYSLALVFGAGFIAEWLVRR